MKKIFLKFALVALAFFFVNSFQTIEANEKIQQRAHTCYDAYEMGGTWVIIKCIGCSQVARVKGATNAGQCGGGGQNQ